MIVFELNICKSTKEVYNRPQASQSQQNQQSSIPLLFQQFNQPKVFLLRFFLKMVEDNPQIVANNKPCASCDRQYIPHRVLNMKEIIRDVALICILDDETKRDRAEQKHALYQIEDILTDFICFLYVEYEQRNENETKLEVKFEQPKPVITSAVDEVREHEEMVWTQAVVLLGVVHQQRPQRTATDQMDYVPVQKQTQQINWPKSQEPSRNLKQQDSKTSQLSILFQQQKGKKESTDCEPYVKAIERQEDRSVLSLTIDRGSRGIIHNDADIGKHNSYQAQKFESREYFYSLIISLGTGLQQPEGRQN